MSSVPVSRDLSPTRLSYVAALRGVVPRNASQFFSYAQVGSVDPESFLCLAASNPNGRFYAVIEDNHACLSAQALATARKVENATLSPTMDSLPRDLAYLCCIADEKPARAQDRERLVELAQKHLAPGGLFAYRYRAYENADETLRFLINEYAPELSADQAKEFLSELKNLGALYFADHSIARDALDKAIASGNPDSFFETCGSELAVSGAFEVMAGLLPRDFAFAGDAEFAANYLELAAPAQAHETLVKCRDHLLYEPIKDFALQRLVRNDVWVKLPADQDVEKSALFGFFTFGITTPREKIPGHIAPNGKQIDLTTPLFTGLINLMCMLPLSVGDFLSHPSGKNFEPEDVLAAIQLLVAAGIAKPMRGRYEGYLKADIHEPVLSGSFNAYLKDMPIKEASVQLASPIVGGPVLLSARDALVLQALSRVGMANSAGALQPELKRILAQNPALAAQIMDSAEANDEMVHNLLTSTIQSGMMRWYAYGLLAA